MSVKRNIEEDRATTQTLLDNPTDKTAHLYLGSDATGANWLGHTKQARLLDIALLRGTAANELHSIRRTYTMHFHHLLREHGIAVSNIDGTYIMEVQDTPQQ